MLTAMTQAINSQTFSARDVAIKRFVRAYLQSRFHRLWMTLTHRTHHLLHLKHIEATVRVHNRHYEGIQTVSINQIRGSENRCNDFDDQFNPLQRHNEERWISVATVMLQGIELSPVELIKVGDTYFVRDGHHRISVAQALGQRYIEAAVTEWRTN